jgi:hypothetical protein
MSINGNRAKSFGIERYGVTVCVAAISEHRYLFGASDRMLTTGGIIQFEPQQSKIKIITTSIALMTAGDSSTQDAIIKKVRADVDYRIKNDPSNWWSVADVAELYRKYESEINCKKAEDKFLIPLGLTYETFIAKQKEMDAQFIRQVANDLMGFAMPDVEAIITGVDVTGPHIYIFLRPQVICMDTVGFAAIGIGQWHANSQFMFAEYDPGKKLSESLLLVYSAKKRAEVAPGVGAATDMFTIGEQLGSFTMLRQDVIDTLKVIYKKERNRELSAARSARKSVQRYIEEIASSHTPKTQAPTTDIPTAD